MSSDETKPHVFVSYDREDHDVMQLVCVRLASAGINTWTDEKLDPSLPSWKREIEQAIRNCSGLVVIMTPDSKESPWVEREVDLARAFGKPVWPLLARGEPTDAIPLSLINAQRLDIRNTHESGSDIERLIQSIRSYGIGVMVSHEQTEAQQKIETPPQEAPPLDEHSPGMIAFEAVGRWLEQDGWYPSRLGERTVYTMRFAGRNGEMNCYAQVIPELELFLFYVVAPIKAQEEHRLAIAEFIARANYGMRIGNFEMDFNDGELRYKTSIDFEGETLTDNLIMRVVYPGCQTMDRYLPAMMKVIFGGVSPLDAVMEVES
ncbi:MAG: TIR domain-containing protein [Chloroflexi bacterium]|nr:TIR domain-containing protein [Chloroflexota bacterium]